MLIVLLLEPMAIRVPSGEKATESTLSRWTLVMTDWLGILLAVGWLASGCPISRPVTASQIRTVASIEPLTMRRPSGEKATDDTAPV
jgi:hypothetical protein